MSAVSEPSFVSSVIQRGGINQARAAELLLAERNGLIFHGKRFAAVEFLQLRIRAVCGVDFRAGHGGYVVADVLAAVQRDHRVSALDCQIYFFKLFELIAIRAKAPVFVDEDILDAVGIRPEDVLPQTRHEEDSSDVDADLDIFEDFLGQIGKDDKDQPGNPSDETSNQ